MHQRSHPGSRDGGQSLPSGTTGIRILVVEDDPLAGPGITALLEMEGFEARLVETGAACRAEMNAFDPHLVVLDVQLPDVDGIALFHELVARRPELPIVISTGHADSAAFADLPSGCRFGFLRKPYPIDHLLGLIAELTAPPVS